MFTKIFKNFKTNSQLAKDIDNLLQTITVVQRQNARIEGLLETVALELSKKKKAIAKKKAAPKKKVAPKKKAAAKKKKSSPREATPVEPVPQNVESSVPIETQPDKPMPAPRKKKEQEAA